MQNRVDLGRKDRKPYTAFMDLEKALIGSRGKSCEMCVGCME